jgi:hypothetical protein
MERVMQSEIANLEDTIPIYLFQINFEFTQNIIDKQLQKDIRRLIVCNTKVKRPTYNLKAVYPEPLYGPLVLEFVEVVGRLKIFKNNGELQDAWWYMSPEMKSISQTELGFELEQPSKFIGVEKLLVEFSISNILPITLGE